MRCLTNLLQRIRLHLARQHIADLEQLLSDLLEARQTLDAEIEHAACRLLEAKGMPACSTADGLDQLLNDISPRNYT